MYLPTYFVGILYITKYVCAVAKYGNKGRKARKTMRSFFQHRTVEWYARMPHVITIETSICLYKYLDEVVRKHLS